MATFADLNQTQFDQLLQSREAAIKEIDRKLAPQLVQLLEKAKVAGSKDTEAKIRMELLRIGHPHADDWFAGEWKVLDSDRITRVYTFLPNNSAKMLYWDDGTRKGDSNITGTFTPLSAESILVRLGTSIILVKKTGSGIEATRWHNATDYPNKVPNMVTGNARRS